METEQEIYEQLMANGPDVTAITCIAGIDEIVYDGMLLVDAIEALKNLSAEYDGVLEVSVDQDYDGYYNNSYNITVARRGYETPKEQKARCKKYAAELYNKAKAKEDKKLEKQKKTEEKERELYEKLKAKFDS